MNLTNNKDYGEVLKIILCVLIEKESNMKTTTAHNLLLQTSLVNSKFRKWCQAKLSVFQAKHMNCHDYYGRSYVSFAFFTVDYIKHKLTLKPFTLRQIAKTMIDTEQRLGKNYKMRFNGRKNRFILETPDGRTALFTMNFVGCDVRIPPEYQDTHKDSDVLLRSEDVDLDKQLLFVSYHSYNDKHRGCFVNVGPHSYTSDAQSKIGQRNYLGLIVSPTMFEYQVLCECFAMATQTETKWSNLRMWQETLTDFQEWMIDNRRRFKTHSNIQFVTDIVEDKMFPNTNDVRVLLSYMQWTGADVIVQERLLIIFGVYEREKLRQNTAVNVPRCHNCKQLLDNHHSDYVRNCRNTECYDEIKAHECVCVECGEQTRDCELHWLNDNPTRCECVGSNESGESGESESKKYKKGVEPF